MACWSGCGTRGPTTAVADWDYEALTLYKLTQEQVDHLEDTVQRFLSTRTKAEIYREALARRFLSFPVHTPEDIVADPQMQARGFFRALRHPEREAPVLYPGPFVTTTAADYAPRLSSATPRRAHAGRPRAGGNRPRGGRSHCAGLE